MYALALLFAAITQSTIGAHRVWIYTPPNYDAHRQQPYDLVVAFDGEEYLEEIPLPVMLDKLPSPAVAVLIDNGGDGARIAELGNSAAYAKFVGEDVVDWMRAHYNVTRDPHRTLITGSSAGGLAAAHVALRYSERLGNVVSQSGAFWRGNEGSNEAPYEWLTGEYERSPKRDIRFVLEVGSLETHGALGGAAPSILAANRHLHDVLVKKGYAVTYKEIAGGVHAPESWRRTLAGDLASMLSRPITK